MISFLYSIQSGISFLAENELPLPIKLLIFTLIFYHLSEPLLQAFFNPSLVNWGAFLFTKEYVLCLVLCQLEFWAEYHFIGPHMKTNSLIIYIGLGMVILGEFIRKLGIITARHNFTHQIQFKKRQQHVLVDYGIYSITRHPGYVGYIIWTIGVQVMLLNPICAILFAIIIWKFFSDRIPVEEEALCQFFPDYVEYRKRVAVVPFTSFFDTHHRSTTKSQKSSSFATIGNPSKIKTQ